jgi:hypothetical protein
MRRNLRKLYRAIIKVPGIVKWYTVIQLAILVGKYRNPRQIIWSSPDTPVILPPKVAIFMHFDRGGRVSVPIITYLKDLVANGRSVIFVTNSGKLTEAAKTQLQEICAAVYIRRNRGYDFGAWRDVIDSLKLPAATTEELIIINDSMYGPLLPLENLLAKINYDEADIWGMTESWQTRYHLQSFFLAFGPKALRSPAFLKFWQTVKPVPAKTYIVKTYEVGITQAMIKAGLRCAAMWKYDDLVKLVIDRKVLDNLIRAERFRLARTDPILMSRRLQIIRIRDAAARRIAMNPTADLWRQLLLTGFPFIKRELLRKNPTEVEDVGDWVEVVRGSLGLDPEPILGELRAGMKNSAP